MRAAAPPGVLAAAFAAVAAWLVGPVARLVPSPRAGAAGYGGLAPTRGVGGAAGAAAIPAGVAIPPCVAVAPALRAIAAPVVGGAPMAAVGLVGGVVLASLAVGGAGAPPRCGAPPPLAGVSAAVAVLLLLLLPAKGWRQQTRGEPPHSTHTRPHGHASHACPPTGLPARPACRPPMAAAKRRPFPPARRTAIGRSDARFLHGPPGLSPA